MDTTQQHPLADISLVRQLSRQNPWLSMGAIFTEWALLFLLYLLFYYIQTGWLYLIIIFLAGTRMYALYSLLHDGIHYLLLPSKKANDLVTRLLLAWPLFIALNRMRKAHFAHHRYLKTDKDPELVHQKYNEFQFPKTRNQVLLIFLMDLTGINFIRYSVISLVNTILRPGKGVTGSGHILHSEGILRAFYYVVLGSLIIYTDLAVWFLLLWLVPYATVYQALNRLRLYTEHLNIHDKNHPPIRTLDVSGFQKFLFAPHNLGFHSEHHLFPSVPFYHLKELHRNIANKPGYEREATVEKSYLSLFRLLIFVPNEHIRT